MILNIPGRGKVTLHPFGGLICGSNQLLSGTFLPSLRMMLKLGSVALAPLELDLKFIGPEWRWDILQNLELSCNLKRLIASCPINAHQRYGLLIAMA